MVTLAWLAHRGADGVNLARSVSKDLLIRTDLGACGQLSQEPGGVSRVLRASGVNGLLKGGSRAVQVPLLIKQHPETDHREWGHLRVTGSDSRLVGDARLQEPPLLLVQEPELEGRPGRALGVTGRRHQLVRLQGALTDLSFSRALVRLLISGLRRPVYHSRSMMVTLAWPPPSHMVSRP
jgi:hypothetical protein